jgi:hypothetical protein
MLIALWSVTQGVVEALRNHTGIRGVGAHCAAKMTEAADRRIAGVRGCVCSCAAYPDLRMGRGDGCAVTSGSIEAGRGDSPAGEIGSMAELTIGKSRRTLGWRRFCLGPMEVRV